MTNVSMALRKLLQARSEAEQSCLVQSWTVDEEPGGDWLENVEQLGAASFKSCVK